MKQQERLKLMRESTDWLDRYLLAKDEVPTFDLFHQIGFARRALKRFEEEGKTSFDSRLEWFGYIMAEAVRNKDSDLFRRWADALDAWSEHDPLPDPLRAELINFCVPQDGSFTMRDIMAHLEKQGLAKRSVLREDGADPWKITERAARRILRELNITVKGSPGRPKKHDTKPRKR